MERKQIIQPPLVDSTCAGLKTFVGAKRYVPGMSMCLQPNIKTSIQPARYKPSRGDQTRNQFPLLPGLPDDLVVACLIRVPRTDHCNLRLVCKTWYRLLAGNYYYSLRGTNGITEEWIYAIKKHRDKRVSWHVFDPANQVWQTLPPVPCGYSQAVGFGSAVLSGCHLYLFGGEDLLKGPMSRVIYYNARTNKWHHAPDMHSRRRFFGSCVINNCLYVAGGEEEGPNQAYKSAEYYDPDKNKWILISDMSMAMIPFVGVVYEGKWFLKGLGPNRQIISQFYQPETNTWHLVDNGMVSGWTSHITSLNGTLYTLDCTDGCKLRIYDSSTDSWNKVIDSKMHLGSSRALEAAAIIQLNGKLCIIRNNMSVTLVDSSKSEEGENHRTEYLWETIAEKGQLKTMITNLWSNIAGRNRLKSHIMHCHVLQV